MIAAGRPVLCAGQSCEWRGGCMRYRIRVSDARWASYDLERVIFMERAVAYDDADRARAGVCPQFMDAPRHR